MLFAYAASAASSRTTPRKGVLTPSNGEEGHTHIWGGVAKEHCQKQYEDATNNFRDVGTDKHAVMRGDEFYHSETAPSLLLVHVGHTCGGSVRRFLRKNSDALDHIAPNHQGYAQVHIHPVRRPVVDGAKGLVIVLRDPVDRLISAYNTEACIRDPHSSASGCAHANWQPTNLTRVPYTVEIKVPERTDAGDDLWRCFPTVGAFADGIDDEDDCGHLAQQALRNSKYGHVAMGACFYLGGVLNKLRNKSVHLIHTETCDADMQAVPKWLGLHTSFETSDEKHTGDFPHHTDTVSHEGRRRLQRHLKHEYALYGQLKKLQGRHSVSGKGAP